MASTGTGALAAVEVAVVKRDSPVARAAVFVVTVVSPVVELKC